MAGVTEFEIAADLKSFIDKEVLPGLPVSSANFWGGLADILVDLAPRNRALLLERERFQTLIDRRNAAQKGCLPKAADEESYLRSIGYLTPAPAPFTITTERVD